MSITLFNGKVITQNDIFTGGLIIEGDRIARIYRGSSPKRADTQIDCEGSYISPGLIDLHCHGTVEGDVIDGTEKSVHALTRLHCAHGTTALLPTTLSSSHPQIKAAVENIKALMKKPPVGARVLGVHLEGNYFAPSMAGAQNPEFLYAPASDDYMDFVNTGIVRRISCAPELKGALEMAERLAPMGIQMSIGHSDGKPKDVQNGAKAGFTSLTHIFNAQSALTSVFFYPDGGVCEASLINDRITVECICDGNHLSPTLLKMVYKLKGTDKMIAVTDSTFSGAPDGDYVFGGLPVVVGNNICLLKDGSAFAGSVATMDLCLRTLYKKAEIPLVEAVKMCSLIPARLISEKETGCLKAGNYADVIVFDDDIRIKHTFVLGKEFNG